MSARNALQNGPTVIIFILWEVCLNCSPVYKTRLTSRSMVMQFWRVLEVVKMGTAIKGPFCEYIISFGYGFMSYKYIWHKVHIYKNYVYHIFSILSHRFCFHIVRLLKSGYVSQSMASYDHWNKMVCHCHGLKIHKFDFACLYWYHFTWALSWSFIWHHFVGVGYWYYVC